ncbi:regulator of chromosome condensation 1/beta-lactamase-inhibitor protein II [Spinellus fusiger]|nr:regulator of chromosome condensation 1/beta-lactamase-inhibitor protein II [Spinellus fusiger]
MRSSLLRRHVQTVRSMHTESLYGWGQAQALPLNRTTQHMYPSEKVYTAPIRLDTHPEYALEKAEPVTHMAAGWCHSLIGTTRHVYKYGLNHNTSSARVISLGQEKLEYLECGREHSHIVIENVTGESSLYSLGSSMYGQLGIGRCKETSPGTLVVEENPVLVNGYKGKITNIACGLDHTVFATDHCSLYAMGWGSDGQLGLGTEFTGDKSLPTPLSQWGNKRIKSMSGSTDFTLVLTEDGILWTWGNSEYGQGMQGGKIDRITAPVRVAFKGVKAMATGGPFSVILTEDGRVHTCGYGALGRGRDAIESLVLNEVEGLKNIERVYATTDYAAAITASGELFTWGLNGPSGRLGLGSVDHAFTPQRVPLDKVVMGLALGTNHALALCN